MSCTSLATSRVWLEYHFYVTELRSNRSFCFGFRALELVSYYFMIATLK